MNTTDPNESQEPVDKRAPSVDRKPVILYCMNYAPELAGIGRYTGEIAQYLSSRGAEVIVVTTPPHYPGWRVQAGYVNSYNTAIEKGVRILRCPLILKEKMGGIWRLIAPLSFALSSAPVVFWQIVWRRPSVVFCVEPTLFAAPAAQLAAKIVGARTTLHVQDLEVDAAFAVGHLGSKSWLQKLGYTFEGMVLKRFSKVITISNRMAEKLRDKGVVAERIAVIRNWVDLSHIYPLRAVSSYRGELGFEEDDFVVLYSGNIGPKQGLHVLLDAAERLEGEGKFHFVIAGDGPAKKQLARQYSHLSNVHFMPLQPYSRLNEFLNMPDLHALTQEQGVGDLVLPSKLGGMLASGRQMVVTAEFGAELNSFLGDAAIIVPPGDVDALARAIANVASGSVSPGDPDRLRGLCLSLAKENGLAAIAQAIYS